MASVVDLSLYALRLPVSCLNCVCSLVHELLWHLSLKRMPSSIHYFYYCGSCSLSVPSRFFQLSAVIGQIYAFTLKKSLRIFCCHLPFKKAAAVDVWPMHTFSFLTHFHDVCLTSWWRLFRFLPFFLACSLFVFPLFLQYSRLSYSILTTECYFDNEKNCLTLYNVVLLQCSVVQCGVVQCSVVRCSVVQCSVVQCSGVT